VVEEGAESHFRGEAGRCPIGWWSGNLMRLNPPNPVICAIYVSLYNTMGKQFSYDLISSHFVRRGLGLASPILRDVSVS
jgi:hypothetical protein